MVWKNGDVWDGRVFQRNEEKGVQLRIPAFLNTRENRVECGCKASKCHWNASIIHSNGTYFAEIATEELATEHSSENIPRSESEVDKSDSEQSDVKSAQDLHLTPADTRSSRLLTLYCGGRPLVHCLPLLALWFLQKIYPEDSSNQPVGFLYCV